MEVCHHGDLSSQILQKTIDHALRDAWIDQLVLGLRHCHNLNIIHRDIKTVRLFVLNGDYFHDAGSLFVQDNILIAAVRGKKMIRYIDFGLAIEVTPGIEIEDGKRAGTPGYMAPELNARLPYACNADVWSLGVVLFQVIKMASSGALPLLDLSLRRPAAQMFTSTPQIELQSNSYLKSRAKTWMPPSGVELRRAWFGDASCQHLPSFTPEFGGVDVTEQLVRCFAASPTAIVFDEAMLLRHAAPAKCGDMTITALLGSKQRKVLLVEMVRKQDPHQTGASAEPLVELIRLDATEIRPITHFYRDIGEHGASLLDRMLRSDNVARPTASELVAFLGVADVSAGGNALAEKDDALAAKDAALASKDAALAAKDAALAAKDATLASALAQIEQLRGVR